MASKRAIRRKSCDGKVRYVSVEEAEQARKKSYSGSRKNGVFCGLLNIYFCEFCNGYHQGHHKRSIMSKRSLNGV